MVVQKKAAKRHSVRCICYIGSASITVSGKVMKVQGTVLLQSPALLYGFSFLTAWSIKLFLSLVVRQRRLLYLLPEGRRRNRLCAGWLVSLAIEVRSGERCVGQECRA